MKERRRTCSLVTWTDWGDASFEVGTPDRTPTRYTYYGIGYGTIREISRIARRNPFRALNLAKNNALAYRKE